MVSKDQLIATLKEVRENLQVCTNLYSDLSVAIDREHQAVREHNIESLRKEGEKKKDINDQLEVVTAKVSEEISKILKSCSVAPPAQPKLSDFQDTLSELPLGPKATTFQLTIWADLKIQVLALVDNLLEGMQELVPKIEGNRFTLQRLLRHHQESFQFWENIAYETFAQYDRQGHSSRYQRESHFRIET